MYNPTSSQLSYLITEIPPVCRQRTQHLVSRSNPNGCCNFKDFFATMQISQSFWRLKISAIDSIVNCTDVMVRGVYSYV